MDSWPDWQLVWYAGLMKQCNPPAQSKYWALNKSHWRHSFVRKIGPSRTSSRNGQANFMAQIRSDKPIKMLCIKTYLNWVWGAGHPRTVLSDVIQKVKPDNSKWKVQVLTENKLSTISLGLQVESTISAEFNKEALPGAHPWPAWLSCTWVLLQESIHGPWWHRDLST
jgi:hypothetical protein